MPLWHGDQPRHGAAPPHTRETVQGSPQAPPSNWRTPAAIPREPGYALRSRSGHVRRTRRAPLPCGLTAARQWSTDTTNRPDPDHRPTCPEEWHRSSRRRPRGATSARYRHSPCRARSRPISASIRGPTGIPSGTAAVDNARDHNPAAISTAPAAHVLTVPGAHGRGQNVDVHVRSARPNLWRRTARNVQFNHAVRFTHGASNAAAPDWRTADRAAGDTLNCAPPTLKRPSTRPNPMRFCRCPAVRMIASSRTVSGHRCPGIAGVRFDQGAGQRQ